MAKSNGAEAWDKFFITLVAIGLVFYAVLLLFWVAGQVGASWGEWAVKLEEKYGAEYVFGIPIAGVVTTVVVLLFGRASPGDASEKYKFKAFGLEFSGPAAPATIWIVLWLTFMATIWLLRPLR
jgi:hypothetical protein